MKKNNKRIVMMASIILVFAVAISGTIAWLFTQTNEVVNTFKPASAPNIIGETPPERNNNIKENVYIRVPSITEDPKSIPVYIRATYVVTWQDANGNVLPNVPKPARQDGSSDPGDYIIEMGTSAKWKLHTDGYYYYTAIVNPGGSTDVLIESCEPIDNAPVDGYTLHVEILSQSIQAKGVTAAGIPAVVDAWKVVTVNADGTLNVPQNP